MSLPIYQPKGEIDPVCGMTVVPDRAAATFDHAGKRYYFCCKGCAQKFSLEPEKYLKPKPSLVTIGGPRPQTVEDPVCHMQVDPADSAGSFSYKDKTYHFCCEPCLTKFQANPEKYLNPTSAPPEPVPEGTMWICPMDPEVREPKPGACPICGMALEPETISLEDDSNPELDDMVRRFRISAVLTAPLLVLMLLPEGAWMTWVSFLLATPVVLWAGFPFFERGWISIRNRAFNMFTLISLGTGAAYLYSVVATLAPGIFPESFRHHGHLAV
jgi:Cu+-exporting ATPase